MDQDQNINLTDLNDKDHVTTFQEKVYVIADEVLSILKELHQEHKKQISSRQIAEKMFIKESVKKVLNDRGLEGIDRENKVDLLKETIDKILDKFSEIVPSYIAEGLSDLKNQRRSKTITEGSTDWLDSAIKSVKRYIDSISNRVNELEHLLQKTTDYLTETEVRLASELSSAQGKFAEDRDFEKNISSNMSDMKQSVKVSGDIDSIKAVVFNKIENINNIMEKKKEQDLLRIKETEKSLAEMSRKMIVIKNEAEAMRKRSQEAEIVSLCDNLTGLYNRKAYDQKIEETLANLARYNVRSSLLVFDIDYFKKVNDKFGHHIGDLTLEKVAQILKKKLRKNDFTARYGGDEVVCILPHTMLEEARKVAEEIRSFIDRTSFTFKGKEVPVKISAGVSAFKKGDDALTIFERADVALYLAKNSGRNLVKTETDVEKAGKSFSDFLIEKDFENK